MIYSHSNLSSTEAAFLRTSRGALVNHTINLNAQFSNMDSYRLHFAFLICTNDLMEI